MVSCGGGCEQTGQSTTAADGMAGSLARTLAAMAESIFLNAVCMAFLASPSAYGCRALDVSMAMLTRSESLSAGEDWAR